MSANENGCAHHVTWSPNRLWRSIFNLCSSHPHFAKSLLRRFCLPRYRFVIIKLFFRLFGPNGVGMPLPPTQLPPLPPLYGSLPPLHPHFPPAPLHRHAPADRPLPPLSPPPSSPPTSLCCPAYLQGGVSPSPSTSPQLSPPPQHPFE